MQAEEIDELARDFYIIETVTNQQEVRKYFEKYSRVKLPEKFGDEDVSEAGKAIMKRIESGDYEYFFQLITQGKTFLIPLMQFSSKIQDIKSIVSNAEKLGLDSFDLIELILGTHDKKYIKSCIKDREKLGIDSNSLKDLIFGTQDIEFIKECIKDRQELRMNSYDIRLLILGMQDIEHIKICIEDAEKIGLESDQIKELIVKTQDIEYMKCCIENKEDLRLNLNDVVEIIISTQDIEYMKSCIKNREKLRLDLNAIVEIIISTQNIDYVENCIENRNELGLNLKTISEIILATGDLDYIKEQQKNGKKLNLEQEEIEKLSVFTQKIDINLPTEMTIGIEIESEAQKKYNTSTLEKIFNNMNWGVKPDISLLDGIEVVSPILTGKAGDEIRKACAILNGASKKISDRCGGHIHIGADYLTSKQDWTNLIEIWTNAEKVIYIIGNEKGTIPREGISQYAHPISRRIEKALENGKINLEKEEDLEEFVKEVSKVQSYRESGINFKNVGKEQKNTIEFRLSNGTINPNTWIENINLFGGIVRTAHELSAIQEKSEEERTEAERKIIENFEVLRTESSEEQVAKALIELCILPEQRQVYMDRYTVNKKLLQSSPMIEKAITKKLSKDKIRRKVFSGKHAVNGEDYKKNEQIIEQRLRQEDIMPSIEQGE